MTDEAAHGQCAVEENAEAFDRGRDCGIVRLNGRADGYDDSFCLVSMNVASVITTRVNKLHQNNFFSFLS